MRTRSICGCLLVSAAALGCESSSEPDLDAWNSSLRIEVAYDLSADSTVLATLYATNTGSQPLEGAAPWGGCAWSFWGYRSANRSGNAAWWSDTSAARECQSESSPLELYIAPGDRKQFVEAVGTLEEIRRSTGSDTLYFTAALRVHGDGSQLQTRAYTAGAYDATVLCQSSPCSGSEDSTSDLDAAPTLALEVSYVVGALELWGTVRATNIGPDTLNVETGEYCAWWFVAYSSPDRESPALWRQSTATTQRACYQGLLELSLAPGETFEFRPEWVGVLAELKALGPQTLYFSAALLFEDPETGGERRTGEIPAGSFMP
jgi:hypothetical protein